MAGNTVVPKALHAMLCNYAQNSGDTLSIVGAGLRLYPKSGIWYLAATWDGTPDDLCQAPIEISFVDGRNTQVMSGISLELGPQIPGDGSQFVRVPLVAQLPAVPDSVKSGVYFVRMSIGGKRAKLPFIVEREKPGEVSNAT